MLYNVVIMSLFALLTDFILKIQVFWHFRRVVLDISKDCNTLCLQGQGVPSLVRLLDPEDRRHCLPNDIPFIFQKNWIFSNITERTSDLWFPFVHCLLQAVITVCVPCSWWCIKQNDGNKLQDARPLVDQALFEYTGHNFYIAVPRRLFRLSSCQCEVRKLKCWGRLVCILSVDRQLPPLVGKYVVLCYHRPLHELHTAHESQL